MNRTRRRILGAAAGIGLAGLGGAAILSRSRPVSEAGDRAGIGIDDVLFDRANPVLGNPDGDLTLVEYFDYQCPFCKRGHSMLTEVVAADGGIRLVMKDWPIFGAPSVLASQLVLGAATLGSYGPAHAALMATDGRLTEHQISRVLRDSGTDDVAAMAAYRSDRARWDGLMGRNASQAAELRLAGTPAFIIGATVYPGALDETRLRAAIDRARRGA